MTCMKVIFFLSMEVNCNILYFAAKLTITLLDVNDNPPHFTPSDVYHANVPESSQPGFEVKRVEAVDIDKNPGPVRYVIYERGI